MQHAGIARTVTGDVAVEDLGRTLMHEHLISSLLCYWNPQDDIDLAGLQVAPELLGRIRARPFAMRDNLVLGDISDAVSEATAARRAGAATIVEVTSTSIGRDPVALCMIAEASGLNIVAGSGYYMASSRPHGFGGRSIDDLADEMIKDLTVGMGDTAVRSGVIGEIAVSASPMEDDDRRLLTAAARAQQHVGACMIVHPVAGQDSAFEVAQVLEEAGADPRKVVMSHLDDRFRDDIRLFESLGVAGYVFGFDTFGRELFYPARSRQLPSDDERIKAIAALVRDGFGDQIVLAQDICMRHELSVHGGHGYDHILRNIVPRLVNAGVTIDRLDDMLIRNPARLLAIGVV